MTVSIFRAANPSHATGHDHANGTVYEGAGSYGNDHGDHIAVVVVCDESQYDSCKDLKDRLLSIPGREYQIRPSYEAKDLDSDSADKQWAESGSPWHFSGDHPFYDQSVSFGSHTSFYRAITPL